jgi:hypothetical protein
MDAIKHMLASNPCYEQHIVSIKQIYEDVLYTILVPAIYEGFVSLYTRARETEKKFIEASKRNPNIEPVSVLVLMQTLIRDIPNLNSHKIRNETDRIKSSTRSADIFDDLVKAVVKAYVILLTYNVDHKRKDLVESKYHENILIPDFIHGCYIQSARNFFGCVELFYHKYEPHILNQNKRTCHKIIKKSLGQAVIQMLPMKEILLEYVTQKYEQIEPPVRTTMPSNLLEDTDGNESNGYGESDGNEFGHGSANNFSLLVSDTHGTNPSDRHEHGKPIAPVALVEPIAPIAPIEPIEPVAPITPVEPKGVKLIDISNIPSRGIAGAFFKDLIPEATKRAQEHANQIIITRETPNPEKRSDKPPDPQDTGKSSDSSTPSVSSAPTVPTVPSHTAEPSNQILDNVLK